MRSKIIGVGILVSCLLVACGSPALTATAPVPQPTLALPTQAGYPGGVPPVPTSPPLGYPGSPPVPVIYQDFEIRPSELSIVAGTAVQFIIASNANAAHQPYSDSAPNAFEAPTALKNNETYEFTFTQPGPVTLLCKVHLEMRATLTVVP